MHVRLGCVLALRPALRMASLVFCAFWYFVKALQGFANISGILEVFVDNSWNFGESPVSKFAGILGNPRTNRTWLLGSWLFTSHLGPTRHRYILRARACCVAEWWARKCRGVSWESGGRGRASCEECRKAVGVSWGVSRSGERGHL